MHFKGSADTQIDRTALRQLTIMLSIAERSRTNTPRHDDDGDDNDDADVVGMRADGDAVQSQAGQLRRLRDHHRAS